MSNSENVGRFVWYDLMSSAPEASKKFYTALFGWKVSSMPVEGMNNYEMITNNEAGLGGILPVQGDLPSHWIAYLSVQDVDATAAQAKQLGGNIHVPPRDIPQVGRFAVVADPQGAAFAPFRSVHPDGPEVEKHPQGTFCWNELLTTDRSAAASFYESLLGWAHCDKDMGPFGIYTVFQRGQRDAAGMMEMPAEAHGPPNWLHYVHVDNTDRFTANAKELGAQVFVAPCDIPHIGRFSVLADPTGAIFALHTPGSR